MEVGMNAAPRIVLLEDHPLVREALVDRLRAHLGDVTIAYAGQSVPDALAAIDADGADCAILDLDLSDARSPVANVLAFADTQVPILIVSALGDPVTIRASLLAGASGFVSKQDESEQFIEAVQATLRGEQYTSPEVATALLSATSTSVPLSDQERRAMVLYASGLKMRAVARRMGVTEGTAQEYIKRVRSKYLKAGTPVPTKTDMYRMARSEGLVP
jgi:two-component system nitrate/nitrite response regulator NarL